MKNGKERYNSILLLDKPSGMTSHDAVAKLRRILKQRRIGHTGTLDKSATGLLVICLGKTTKAAQFISDADKTYEAKITLGRKSKTYDAEGVDFNSPENRIPDLDRNALNKYLDDFRGTFIQKVPPYSAIHKDGQRLYKLAVKGEDFELPEREITIHSLEITAIESTGICLSVHCSKGTYIRSLANDLGDKIGCGAYLSYLRRTAVGHLKIEDALTLEKVEQFHQNDVLNEYLISCSQALDYVSCMVNDNFIDGIYQGRDILADKIQSVEGEYHKGDKVAVKDSYGNILAVCKAEYSSDVLGVSNDKKLFSYIRVLN